MKNKILIVLSLIALVLICYVYYSNKTNKIFYEDKNKNEIWDDLEPFIEENAKTEDERKALEHLFKTYQLILLNPKSGLKFKKNHGPTDFFKAKACVRSIFLKDIFNENNSKNKVLSSWARHRAWTKYNANLSGGIYHGWNKERDGEPCSFKVEKNE